MESIGLYFHVFLLIIFVEESEFSMNIALGKTATQSSDFNPHWLAGNAVDGNTGGVKRDVGCNCCTHTGDKQQTVWWQVDLTTESRIQRVEIIYRTGFSERLAGFHLYLTNKSQSPEGLCYKDEIGSLPNEIQNISCPYTARYVFIYNERLPGVRYPTTYSEFAILELCEVKVYGCQVGRYGEMCQIVCPSGCKIDSYVCDPGTGDCIYCKDDFTGPKCDVCKTGKYGPSCNKNCSHGCINNTCAKVDGKCGCETGFAGSRCDVCIDGKFGENCVKDCSKNCLNDTCDRTVGDCSFGCNRNWNGSKCDECSVGLYGDICDKPCSSGCLSGGGCERARGICNNGCNEGLIGTTCNECSVGLYGDMCDKPCSSGCLSGGGCERVRGICNNGCNEGLIGTTCNDCKKGRYGTYCQRNCSENCIETECNRTNGGCLRGCTTGWNGVLCNVSLTSMRRSLEEKTPVSMIAGIVVGIVVVLVAVFIIILFLKRRSLKKPSNKSDSSSNILDSIKDNITPNASERPRGEKELDGSGLINATAIINDRGDIYENTTELYYNVSIAGIPVKELKEYTAQKTKSDFEKEYKKLPDGAKFPLEYSTNPRNKAKNRFQKPYCYDHSRVILDSLTDQPDSDYVNANYIDRVEDRGIYIATQGPKPNTITDFWRMVWQVKSSIIVMLTNLVEGGKVKCEQYWPETGQKLEAGQLSITTETVYEYVTYSLRIIRLTNITEDESRQIFQFHFTSWPDHGTPDSLEIIIFHRKIISRKIESPGPFIVHCSAGIGRTGTFIALDSLFEYGKRTGRIDIFDFVKTMRKDRMNMIQNLEQYIFLHEVLVDAFNFRDTTLIKEKLSNLFDSQELKTDSDTIYTNSTSLPWIQEEYKILQSHKQEYQDKDYKSALSQENHHKNKENCPLAMDRYRAFIMSRVRGGSNYINAVILPSYSNRKGYITSHIPLQNTVVDCWSMIVDHECTTVVLLDLDENDQPFEWIPLNKSSLEAGPFKIKNEGEETLLTGIKKHSLSLTEKENTSQITLRTCILPSWTKGLPPSKQSMLKLIELVDDMERSGGSGTIAVFCPDGVTACGLFCVVRDLICSLRLAGEVDVFQTVRQKQIRRLECISSVEQYQYCYEILNEYLNNENIYANE